MFSDVIEAAIKRRRELKEILKLFYERSEEEKENEVIFKELPPKAEKVYMHGAEDGGHRVIDLEAYSIYIIKAYSLCMKKGKDTYEIPVERRVADVNVIIPSQFIDERASLYREVLEIWVSKKLISECKPEVFFWDGSLRPLLIRHRPGAHYW
jgi:hypothetical protein